MALVVICGQPCSGKSRAALCLAEALKESGSNQIVRVIDETSFHLDRNESYANVPAEKNLRGVLRSEVDRSVSKDSIIIVDSLNSIKGVWLVQRESDTVYYFAKLMKPIVENGMKSAGRREKLLIMIRYLKIWREGLRHRREEISGTPRCLSYGHIKRE